MGTVKNFLKETDTIEVEFDTEKGVSYQYCVEKEVRARKVKLARSAEKKLGRYEELTMIGAIVEVKWTENDLANTGWSAGRYYFLVISYGISAPNCLKAVISFYVSPVVFVVFYKFYIL